MRGYKTKNIKFVATWVSIFGVLGVFTIFTMGGVLANLGTAKAYAQTINQDSVLTNSNNLVAVTDTSTPQHKRLINAYENQKICSVDNDQYNTLKNQFDATIQEIHLATGTVKFVVVPKTMDHEQKYLKNLLYSTAANTKKPHCRTILNKSGVWFWFKGDVS